MILNLTPMRNRDQNQAVLSSLVFVVFWTIAFTLAYAQSPLFTSNQNQYFIHGLADAGYGTLDQDWLANTLDPTPAFSTLISLTYRLTSWVPAFYILFTLLAGIYLFGLYSILGTIFDLKDTPSKRWGFMAALVGLHSAVIRYLVVRLLDQDWSHLFDGGVAGQRLLGTVLQPSAFGVFLLLAVSFFLQGKPFGAILCLTLGATFHPTYLLSAGVLTLVFMGLMFRTEKCLWRPLTFGAGALLGVTPVLINTLRTFGGTHPILATRARELLVEFRIPHHALPTDWFDGSVLVKVAFIVLALYLSRKTTLFHILLWPFAVAVVGTLAQVVSNSDVLALLFPWRISSWLVPISTGVILFHGLEHIWPKLIRVFPEKWIFVLILLLASTFAGTGLVKSLWEYRERVNSNDRPIMAEIRETNQPGDVTLIPLDMQDFRLETGAPAYVEFKSIPYKDTDVLEWYRRVSLAGSLYRAPYKREGCQIVSELASEGVTHVILPYDHTLQKCDNLKRGYWDWNYVLYVVRER